MVLDPGEVSIDVDTTNDATVLTVAGELDLATAPKLRTALAEATDGGADTIRLDLSQVSFLDSSAISVLVETQEGLQGAGRSLVLHGLLGHTRRVLEIAGLTSYFQLSDEPTGAA